MSQLFLSLRRVGLQSAVHSSGLQSGAESIQEFRVVSALYPAEYGTGTGGQIDVISQSDGNKFHGAAFGYLRNDKLDARRRALLRCESEIEATNVSVWIQFLRSYHYRQNPSGWVWLNLSRLKNVPRSTRRHGKFLLTTDAALERLKQTYVIRIRQTAAQDGA